MSEQFLYGMLTGIALGCLSLIVAGVLHIKGKFRLPGTPGFDRPADVEREEGGATAEDVR